MGTRRLGLALVIALIISVTITYFFYERIKQSGDRSQTKQVLAASTALQPGTPLTADNLTEIDWPSNVALEGLIEKKEDAVGRILIYGIEAKAPVLKQNLAPSGSFGLAAKIPAGMRATSVKTNEVTDVNGFIFPGAHVDVMVTMRPDNNVSSTVTRTVLQNVQVLATGSKTDPDPNGKPENVTTVTLLVTPEDSEKLALAQNQAALNQGSIHLVLRNGGDMATMETAPVDMAELTGTAKPQPAVAHSKHRAAPKAPAAPEYTVETYSGGKVLVSKFPVNAK